MAGRRATVASLIVLLMLVPMASSNLHPALDRKGGSDADGVWTSSVESDLHSGWWEHWSRDKDRDSLDDRLEWILEQQEDFQRDWWKRADSGFARVIVDYDHHPSDADVSELEKLGVDVTFRPKYLDSLIVTAPLKSITSSEGIRSLTGVVMIEDLGLAEPHMAEAIPNMGVDLVWNDFGFDGTGSVVAVLDTGVRGDHEGLNDMDDEPFTTGCEQPSPDPLDPNPIFVDCDPKIIAFYDAVLMDAEQDLSLIHI